MSSVTNKRLNPLQLSYKNLILFHPKRFFSQNIIPIFLFFWSSWKHYIFNYFSKCQYFSFYNGLSGRDWTCDLNFPKVADYHFPTLRYFFGRCLRNWTLPVGFGDQLASLGTWAPIMDEVEGYDPPIMESKSIVLPIKLYLNNGSGGGLRSPDMRVNSSLFYHWTTPEYFLVVDPGNAPGLIRYERMSLLLT